ncbi:hypothetical protein [Pseudocnuella soli]|uniref:hypothetical protein n=1 Tax=Pseudocnuella soli TaxID=2502779 RepID=UPI00104A98DE|nr:hypothetical protein [Pseudocnuella soli]
MKKNVLAPLGCCLLCLIFAHNAAAQEVKKLPEVFVTTAHSAPISSKLSQAFYADFANARQPFWDKQGKYFYVYFLTDDMSNRAKYTKRGSILYQMSYGHEHNLPNDIRHLLQTSYHDYAVSGVTHVKMDRQNVWLANLQDNKNLLVVRVDDAGVALLSRYDRAQ